MKKNYLIVLCLILFTTCLFAQNKSALENAQKYLDSKGEVVIRFKANSQSQFLELNKILSVSHKRVDQADLEVEAYANKEQFKKFLTYGLTYEVRTSDNEIVTESNLLNKKTAGTWDTTWDAYPKYSEYVAKMQYWAVTYPSLCTLQSIGTTPNGRKLFVLKISDNATADETEPEFLYTSSMHGDEITGYPTMLHFIDYLLTNYGTLPEITNIVNGTELFICPLANPDGSYRAAVNDTYNIAGYLATRSNANSIDLNRNYADAIGGIHPDGNRYQTETTAFLNFEATRNFVLAANYHGGTEVVNFPWDTSNTPNTGNFSYHPHDNYFKYVSKEYAQLCQTADGNLNYMDEVYNTGQFPGTTNGAAWYSVYGGRQDYNNFFNHNKEVTVEISNAKTPLASDLTFFWDRNRQALLSYIKQASYGLHGRVTDASGNPIHAKVYISGTLDGFGSWVETSTTLGDYHKVQIAGTYNVIFEAPGYVSQTQSTTLTNGATTTLNIVMVPTTTIPTASDTTICEGQTAALIASGSGTLHWYTSATATTPLASAATLTTPALTANSSYFVESVVPLANVGPTAVSGTATTNINVANRYLIFNCTTPTKLKSVLISSSAVGEIHIELQNSAGIMLESKVVRLTSSGAQDIALDFFLPAENNLRLASREITNMSLSRSTSAVTITYPITNGTVSITGNSGTGIFYQFFNWKFEPVKSNRKEVIVTVNPATVPGSITGGTSICSDSASGLLTLAGYTGNIVRWEKSVNPFTVWTPIANTNSTYSSGVLNETTKFRAIVKSGICDELASAATTVSIDATTWNGTAWSNSIPTATTKVILSGNYTATTDLSACSLTVNNNAVVLVNSGVNFNISGDIIVSPGASLTFTNNTNLVQTKNTNGNTGNIILKRQTSDLKLSDYVLWSAPVSGQQLQSFSPSTLSNRFYTYNPSTNLYNAIVPTNNFAIGSGYLVRMPNNHPTSPTIWEGQFQGVPNNGNYNITVTNDAYNAIGNPYPSTINANTFISTNNITEALYFWRKTNNTATSSYATYTTAGGTANAGGLSSVVPNGIIQVGQGFLVKATTPTISFTNTMRVANTGNQFLKTKETELHRIWLNLSKDATPVNQMLIAYMPKATSGIDATIDGRYINDNATALNSLIENEEFVIQGRSLPFSDSDIVPLTFKTSAAGSFTIGIDHVDGLFSDSQNIFLNDKITSANHDLKKTSYSFTATAGTFNDRFEIVYKENSTLGLEDAVFNEDTVLVYNQKGIININAGKKTIVAVKIFDIRGRLIYKKNDINSTITALDPFVAAHQTLIIQITSNENKVVSKKLMY
jgi:hypothetical protein